MIIPQSSKSLNGFLVDLGNLNLSNQFLEIPFGRGKSVIDHIQFRLDNLEIKRVVFEKNSDPNLLWVKEQLMQPVNLTGELMRTLKNADPQHVADIDVKVQLLDLECFISQKSLKLLFAILNENLNEGSPPPVVVQSHTKKTIDFDRYSIGGNKRLSITAPKPASSVARRPSLPPPIHEESTEDVLGQSPDRVNIKLFVDLKRIKLIIVELISNNDTAKTVDNADKDALVDISEDDKNTKELRIKRINNAYRIIDFSHLEIQDIDFDYVKHNDLSWLAIFKMKEMHLNDIRPDSNLAVKE